MIYIGTSGWTYKHWKGIFYPADLVQRRWLEYYAQVFATVEINASFYRIPKSSVTEGWAQRTPENFGFSIKVSRLITHVHRLVNCDDIIEWFFREMEPLGGKILVYLFQLPPSFCPRPETLRDFVHLLPPEYRYVFEFRNERAYSGPLLEILKDLGIGFCIHDFPGRETPSIITGDLVYVRFHGYGRQYAGSYPDNVLEEWAHRMKRWVDEKKRVFVYFNNDLGGSAVFNAQMLRKIIEGI